MSMEMGRDHHMDCKTERQRERNSDKKREGRRNGSEERNKYLDHDHSEENRGRSREDRDRRGREDHYEWERRERRDRSPRTRDYDRERDRREEWDRSLYRREDDLRRSPDTCRWTSDFDRGSNIRDPSDSESFKKQTPNNTIMIRGLLPHIMENDIRQDILKCGLMPKDIRLIRKKDTGISRGFAFVEFNSIQEATCWMDTNQGMLMLHDQYRAVMQYSVRKEGEGESTTTKTQDWFCVKCGAHNFKKRAICFKCYVSRDASEGGQGSEEVSSYPTHTILLRGLDVLSTEDSVLQAIQNFSSLPIRSIRIGRNSITDASRGVCYLEMNNVADAMYLYNALDGDPPVVDGKKVLVSYCKLPQVSTCPSEAASIALAAAQWSNQNENMTPQHGPEDVERLAKYSAAIYATTPEELVAYIQYYRQYYQNQMAQADNEQKITKLVGENVPCAQLMSSASTETLPAVYGTTVTITPTTTTTMMPSYSNYNNAVKFAAAVPATTPTTVYQHVTPPAQSAEQPQYFVPDVSAYQYDEASGYYYDPQTGLYYDATSQYYYNAQAQQFLYWDAEKRTYLPVPTSKDAVCKDEEKKVKEIYKPDKVKVAKKIAKDMEKWAKTLNQKKEIARQNLALAAASSCTKSSGAADAGFAVIERKEQPPLTGGLTTFVSPQESPPDERCTPDLFAVIKASTTKPTGLVAEYGGGTDSEEEEEGVLDKYTDWTKLACLLCKRQFPSKDGLVKHQQLSGLHKQNLEAWRKVRVIAPSDPEQQDVKYRDRAKERRLKFGELEPTQPNNLKEKYFKAKKEAAATWFEEPTKAGIGPDNIGSKILHKMGWHEGMGLGKANQGRTKIIESERRTSTAGLGTRIGNFGALAGESYKECVKKLTFARYQDLMEQDNEVNS